MVMLVFVTMVLGAIDLSRWLYAIDAIGEAGREGARVASVCNLNAAAIVTRMQPALAMATGGTATTTYTPAGCCAQQSNACPVACTGVTVQLTGYYVPRIAPFLPTMTLPNITTYLPRESLDSTNNDRCS